MNIKISFSGRYCLQTSCDLHPCQNGGLCSLTSDGYVCSCPQGFGGPHCERRLMPCETEPCVNGICIEDKTRKDGYRCQCHLWWIGTENKTENVFQFMINNLHILKTEKKPLKLSKRIKIEQNPQN